MAGLEARSLPQTLSEAVLETAGALIDRHPLRAYDAIQLAGCIILRSRTASELPIFVAADEKLLEAAEFEGLPILNPESRI